MVITSCMTWLARNYLAPWMSGICQQVGRAGDRRAHRRHNDAAQALEAALLQVPERLLVGDSEKTRSTC